jgi:hypothetical protein
MALGLAADLPHSLAVVLELDAEAVEVVLHVAHDAAGHRPHQEAPSEDAIAVVLQGHAAGIVGQRI